MDQHCRSGAARQPSSDRGPFLWTGESVKRALLGVDGDADCPWGTFHLAYNGRSDPVVDSPEEQARDALEILNKRIDRVRGCLDRFVSNRHTPLDHEQQQVLPQGAAKQVPGAVTFHIPFSGMPGTHAEYIAATQYWIPVFEKRVPGWPTYRLHMDGTTLTASVVQPPPCLAMNA